MNDPRCIFCKIATGELASHMVYSDADCMAFLDVEPLFHGHVLLCPLEHFATFGDLPSEFVGALFAKAQLLTRAVEAALDAEGSFVAINNTVSQTVPHLHVHIVPRRRRDGLKGFFWPRHSYKDEAAKEAVRDVIEREVNRLLG